jgi:hypothetical protein
MTTHTSPTAGRTQCAAILEALAANRGRWVPMPELVATSGSFNVHSRIADLRKRGHVIEQRNARHGTAVHSFYRLP